MSQGAIDRGAAWIYRGVWASVVRWFRVPAEPPSLPVDASSQVQSFRPSPGYLRYRKFNFWVVLAIIDVALSALWLAIFVWKPWLGFVISPLALTIIVLPDIIAYVAIHLRYDTTWYVLSDRAMRLRRGIWLLHETTITYENIQNVRVTQGPLQRYFGIADVLVETAGGGGTAGKDGSMINMHVGVLEGVDNATAIRDLIMQRAAQGRSAGLGDEHALPLAMTNESTWTPAQVAMLESIADLLRQSKTA
jgi:membrane protein YdbS with pleckstrin-like domain